MAIFDGLKEALYPEVVSTYQWIMRNHYDAFLRWKKSMEEYYLFHSFHSPHTFEDKRYIAENKDSILVWETIIKSEQNKEKVINAAGKYPHAFYNLIERLKLPNVKLKKPIMPGDRISKYSYNEKKRASASSPTYYNLGYGSLDYELVNGYYQRKVANYPSFSIRPEKTSVYSLNPNDYEKISPHIGSLENEENEILNKMKREELVFKFEDEVLGNTRRAKYYKKFANSKNITASVQEYCANNLTALDTFIRNTIRTNYARVKSLYPNAAKEFEEQNSHLNEETRQELVGDSERKLETRENVIKEYKSIQRRYPKGLKAYEEFRSYNNGKPQAKPSFEEIVAMDERVLKNFEDAAPKVEKYQKWEEEQKEFTHASRNANLDNWGCYKYNLDFETPYYEGTTKKGTYLLWQHFYSSFCENQELDYSDFQATKKNFEYLPELKGCRRYYFHSVYDDVIKCLCELQKKYNNLVVIFGNSGLTNANNFNKYHFQYLRGELDKNKIKHYDSMYSFHYVTDAITHFVVVEVISTNKHIKEVCYALMNQGCGRPCITYISILKEFDTVEMTNLITTEQQEKRKKEEAIKMQEEEKRRRDRERQLKEKQKQEDISSLKNCVSRWKTLRSGLPYNYLLSYYPTTCDFDANDEEWNNRRLVWFFKNTPGKTSEFEHNMALEILLPKISLLLKTTFGDKLSKLTLVCIPAATKAGNDARFDVFSKTLIEQTNMSNAFTHIQISKDASSKHTGGSGFPDVHIDEDYFKDRYVLLFDDIITQGSSMNRYKQKLEACGATIIAGLSIGLTKHKRE